MLKFFLVFVSIVISFISCSNDNPVNNSSTTSSSSSISSSSSSSVEYIEYDTISPYFRGQVYDDTVVVYDYRDSLTYPKGSPVDLNGKLQVIGTKLCNEKGIPIQIKGISTMGPQWTERYINPVVFDSLRAQGATLIRIAMYVGEGGYMHSGLNPTESALFDSTVRASWRNKIDQWVYEIGKRGMYCIIDWHVLSPGDPWETITGSIEFWKYMSKKHGFKKHVLFEICNEPNSKNNHEIVGGVQWDAPNTNRDIKGYAEYIIPIIRHRDPTNTVIIVGNEFWSSKPEEVLGNELKYPNIMYTYHYYTDLHGELPFEKLNALLKVPVFVTEWGGGYTDYDYYLMSKFLMWMYLNKISWAAWAINGSDNLSIFKEGTNPTGPFEYSEYGELLLFDIKYNPDYYDGEVKGPYTIKTKIMGKGKVEIIPNKKTYNYEDTITIKAIPEPGYEFSKWGYYANVSDSVLKFTIRSSMYFKAIFKEIGNFVFNGDFESGKLGWTFETYNDVSFNVVNGVAVFDIKDGGLLPKFAKLISDKMSLKEGDYQLNFDAKAKLPKIISVAYIRGLEKDGTPFLIDTLTIDTTFKKYTLNFSTIGNPTIPNDHLYFYIGGDTTNVLWLDNIRIEAK